MSENSPIDAVTEVAKSARSFNDLAKSVLSPMVKRWQTAAELHEIEKKIDFAKRHPEVEFVMKEDGSPGFVTSMEQELAIRAGRRLFAEAEKKQINLEQIYLNAAKEIGDIEVAPEAPIYEDWLTRLNSIGQEISDPEMQFIWGKILAGEYKQPGSFSLRTLDTIRNMSRQDAELFEKILPLVCSRHNVFFISSDAALLKKYGISYASVMHLDECGLMNSAGAIQLHLFHNGEITDYIQNEQQIMIFNNADGLDTSVGIHPLTSAGKELYNALLHKPNSEYFCDFTKHVFSKTRGSEVSVSVHKINYIEGDNINYFEEKLLDFSKKGDTSQK